MQLNRLAILLLAPLLLTGALPTPSAPQVNEQTNAAGDETVFRKRPRIAVLPFQTASARVKEIGLGEAITSMVVTELRDNSNYVTVERSRLRAVIDEKTLMELGLTQSASEKLMTILGVEVVFLGEIAYLGATIHIDARMVEVPTSRVAVADFVQTNSLTTLRSAIASLVQRMLLDYLRPWMGDLEIASDPPGAEVYLNGNYVGTTGLNLPVKVDKLIEGRYNVKIIAGGYIDWEGEIVVLPKMSQSFNIPLIAKPGSMTIRTEPTDAEVYLDNNLMGKTPLTLKEVAEGEHDLRIEKETYKEWSRKVVVRSFQPTDVNVTLEVLPAMLIVQSEPSEASVYFMGRARGVTPLTLSNLTPGEVVMRLTKTYYEEWVSSFLLAPNERREIDAVLVRQVGLVSASSIPDGAEVFLRNLGEDSRRLIGVTPIFNHETTVGDYLVEFEKKEFFSASVSTTVIQDALAEVSVTLDEKPGQLYVETVPENAQIFINDTFAGRTPLITDLSRGSYSVRMSLPFATFEESVTIHPDTMTQVSYQFKKPRSYLLTTFWVNMMTVILFLMSGQ